MTVHTTSNTYRHMDNIKLDKYLLTSSQKLQLSSENQMESFKWINAEMTTERHHFLSIDPTCSQWLSCVTRA